MIDTYLSTTSKGSGLQGVPWKDFSKSGLNDGKIDGLRVENLFSKQTDQSEPVCKSKRVPKKRLDDGALDDGAEDDDEIRFLEKVKTSKIIVNHGAGFEDEEGGSRKHQKILRVLKRNVDNLNDEGDVCAGVHGSPRFGKECKKSKSGRVSKDTNSVEEEDLGSDGDRTSKRKKPRKELVDLSADSKKEMTVTTRQRALQTGRDVSSGFASLIEFPYGLPPAPPKSGGNKKNTEPGTTLSLADACSDMIRKVPLTGMLIHTIFYSNNCPRLCSRTPWNDYFPNLLSRHIAFLSASQQVILFFFHMDFSYPPPREKCAAPYCTNLPLCSLHCYKTIHEKMQPLTAC
ncbi:hypothetical protein DKX38_001106 [Salix brachista]|uniref:INO80 complex subunit B-like conserved region domain-containing protein n=1 Tax=Salix brachista TaxID=2182728 RepID=A0A5N5P2T0_9ROSI|nr:hypothetical protein DKX38_001106 [Salix brachista]